jgi:hypothetical protein
MLSQALPLSRVHCDREHLVLIQTGLSDESLAYYTPAIAGNKPSEFFISLSESSLLLDRLKLKRELAVFASFGEQSFSASLSIISSKVILTLSSASLEPSHEDHHYYFLT